MIDAKVYEPGVTVVLANAIVPELVIVPPERPVPAVIDVTVPVVEEVPAPIAVLNVAASKVDTVLSALIRKKVTADGLVSVNRFEPTVVAPSEVRPVEAVKPVAPPSHRFLSEYAVFQSVLDPPLAVIVLTTLKEFAERVLGKVTPLVSFVVYTTLLLAGYPPQSCILLTVMPFPEKEEFQEGMNTILT